MTMATREPETPLRGELGNGGGVQRVWARDNRAILADRARRKKRQDSG